MRQIDIIIVNWNAGARLERCLRSITASNDYKLVNRVVVVDNGSSDNSLEKACSLGLPLEIISNSENLGFARACNQGAALCDAGYLLFLNPDTELVPGSLAVPLRCMEVRENERVGICGVQLLTGDGKVSRSCAHFPSFGRMLVESIGINRLPFFSGYGVHMKEWDHLATRKVDHVIGAFFFVRRSVFNSLQGFDERFFVYLEDLDFSFRAGMAGWHTVFLASGKAFHEGGGTSRQVKSQRLFYALRSRLLYCFKHFPSWQAWGIVAATVFVEPLSRIMHCLLTGAMSDIGNTLRAYSCLLRELPAIVAGDRDEGRSVQ